MKTKKYTLQITNEINVEGTNITVDEDQLLKIILDTGVTLFESEYTKEFYFINATQEQVEKLKKFKFVDFVEKYNESYFKTISYKEICVDLLEELEGIRSMIDFDQKKYDKKIFEIEEVVKILKYERN